MTLVRSSWYSWYFFSLALCLWGCGRAPVPEALHPTPNADSARLLLDGVVELRAAAHGAALVLDQEQALTSASLVRDALSIELRDVRGQLRQARTIAIDEPNDLALLQVETAFDGQWSLPPLSEAHPEMQAWAVLGSRPWRLHHWPALDWESAALAPQADELRPGTPIFGQDERGLWILGMAHADPSDTLPPSSWNSRWRGERSQAADPWARLEPLREDALSSLRNGHSVHFDRVIDAARSRPALAHQALLAHRVQLEASDELFGLVQQLRFERLPAKHELQLWSEWRHAPLGEHRFELRVVRFDEHGNALTLLSSDSHRFVIDERRHSYVHHARLGLEFAQAGQHAVLLSTQGLLSAVLPFSVHGPLPSPAPIALPYQKRPLQHVLLTAQSIEPILASDAISNDSERLRLSGSFDTIALQQSPQTLRFSSLTVWQQAFAGRHQTRLQLLDPNGELLAEQREDFELADEQASHTAIHHWEVVLHTAGPYVLVVLSDGVLSAKRVLWATACDAPLEAPTLELTEPQHSLTFPIPSTDESHEPSL